MNTKHANSGGFFKKLKGWSLKSSVRLSSSVMAASTILLSLAGVAIGQVSGDFTYSDNGAEVIITGYAVGAPTDVVIPSNIVVSEEPLLVKPVIGIGTSAFEGRFELTSVTIPVGVTSIGMRAFYNCSTMTTVSLPAGVTIIDSYSFFGCIALKNISIPSSVTSIGRNAFNFCSALTSMPLQSGLLTIEREAFSRCGGLTSLTIPPGVTTIGIGAFSYCSGLTSLEIPASVTSLASGIFSNCSRLTSVTLPSTITSFGTFAFEYCSGLTSITIPNVATLPNRVFANCRGLTSVSIPASVTTISVTAFAQCSALTSFTVAAANPNFSSLSGLLTNKDQTRLITAPGGISGNFPIPVALNEIGNQAFQYCGELTGVTFHAGVTVLGSQAFSTCGKLLNAFFLGNPPAVMGSNVFDVARQGFAIYYLMNETGFSSPTWYGYPAYDIGQMTSEFDWLYSYGLPGHSNLLSDTNGDGVSLLMAYALDMNPNVLNTLPQPVFIANQMSLSFYAGRPGITYRVKTSADLADWTTEVPLSELDASQHRTATVAFSGPARFMRLEVSR